MRVIKSSVCVLLSVFVLFIPSFAWDSQSFVGDDFYFYEPVIGSPSKAPALSPYSDSISSSVSGESFLKCLSVNGQYVSPLMRVHNDKQWFPPDIDIPSYDGPSIGDWSLIEIWDDLTNQRSFGSQVSYDLSSYDSVTGWYGPCVSSSSDPVVSSSVSSSLFYDFDISSFGVFSSFELSGLSYVRALLQYGSSTYNKSTSLSLYVNDSLVHVFYPDSNFLYDFSSFVYNSSVPITSIQFELTWSLSSYRSFSLPSSGNVFCLFRWISGSVPPSFTVLSGDDVLIGQSDQTQDDINKIDSLESDWGGSMTENFNALSIDSFTYPDGLTSAFALISGIFQDLWNAFGSYSILYVLPLTLAIVLLVIGRISKFAGQGRGSPKEE